MYIGVKLGLYEFKDGLRAVILASRAFAKKFRSVEIKVLDASASDVLRGCGGKALGVQRQSHI